LSRNGRNHYADNHILARSLVPRQIKSAVVARSQRARRAPATIGRLRFNREVARQACALAMLRSSPGRLMIILGVMILTALGTFTIRCGSAIAATVTLSSGDNIQNAVDAHAPGTTFVLRPGVYREDSVVLVRYGDSFIGQAGAILNGAKVVTGWTRVSINGVGYWTAPGGTPLATPRCGAGSECCMAGYQGCVYVQDLYVDNNDYQHVTSLAEVVSRTSWYYDFDGADGGIQNNIYLAAGDDPNSHLVELGDKKYSFRGSASNIAIRNLIIEKYAAPIQDAAIQAEGPHWVIQGNEVRLNHGVGIAAKLGGDFIRVIGNQVNHNGQMGLSVGGANNGLWDANYVAYNNLDHVNPDFEAGGSKFVGNYITISHNIVHDNYGVGLFTDDGGTHNTYDHNTSYNNNGGGIRYEISRYGTITDNTVYGNTHNPQIVYTGSDHGRIAANTVIDAGWGAIGVWNITGTRPRSREPIYQVTDTQVTRNTIETSCTPNHIAAGLVDFAKPAQPGIFNNRTTLFDYNIYKVPSSFQFASGRPAGKCWHWGELTSPYTTISWSAWQARGQDIHGAVVRSSAAR
jgi:parallel beta-helix repeat protein